MQPQSALQVDGVRAAERRASSPFQNGRTEVLIGEPEGGPRSPRGSTSSAVNDGPSFLNTPDDTEPIRRYARAGPPLSIRRPPPADPEPLSQPRPSAHAEVAAS